MGVAGLLSHLLQNEPKAFIMDARKRKALGPEDSQKVFQRLTVGDTSCHVIATPAPAGGDAVVCSARMAEIFLCPQELSRLLHMTGVASFFFWPMCVRMMRLVYMPACLVAMESSLTAFDPNTKSFPFLTIPPGSCAGDRPSTTSTPAWSVLSWSHPPAPRSTSSSRCVANEPSRRSS